MQSFENNLLQKNVKELDLLNFKKNNLFKMFLIYRRKHNNIINPDKYSKKTKNYYKIN